MSNLVLNLSEVKQSEAELFIAY